MKRGFSLIEILVVIGVMGAIFTFGMVINMNAFTENTLQNEESKLISALERARSHAMANMFQSSFAICYISSNYIISYDNACDGFGSDEIIPANTNIAKASNFSTIFPTIIFTRLSGIVSIPPPPITIIITDGNKSTNITINNEGAINW